MDTTPLDPMRELVDVWFDAPEAGVYRLVVDGRDALRFETNREDRVRWMSHEGSGIVGRDFTVAGAFVVPHMVFA